MVERAMQNVVSTGHAAENQAVTAIAGGGNLTEVVQAVSRAELALQTDDRDPRPHGVGVPGDHAHADVIGPLSARPCGGRGSG